MSQKVKIPDLFDFVWVRTDMDDPKAYRMEVTGIDVIVRVQNENGPQDFPLQRVVAIEEPPPFEYSDDMKFEAA